MTNEQIILYFWIVFAGFHLVACLSSVRKYFVAKIGEDIYVRYTGTLLWDLSHHTHAYKFFRGSSLVFLFQSAVNPSPAEISAVTESQVVGIVRVTRHAQFFASVMFALGGIFDEMHVVDAIFFVGFPIFFVLGTTHQEMRQRNTKPKYYFQQTSVLPFKAILEGRNSLRKTIAELDVIALAAAVLMGAFLTYYPLSSIEQYLSTLISWNPYNTVVQ